MQNPQVFKNNRLYKWPVPHILNSFLSPEYGVQVTSSTSLIKQSITSKAVDTSYDVIGNDKRDVLSSRDVSLILNEEKKAKQEELDGYYMIISSETNLTWNEILDTYGKLKLHSV